MKKKKQLNEPFLLFFLPSGKVISGFAKNLHDSYGSTLISSWMDKGYGGGYHRLFHGHDIGSNIVPFIKEHGLKKVPSYIKELGIDFLSPNGLPLPFTQKLAENGILSESVLTKWFSLNLPDSLTGGIALYHTKKFYDKSKKGLKKKDLAFGFVGIGIKMGYGVYAHNPLLIISAVGDVGTVLKWSHKVKKQIKKDLVQIEKDVSLLKESINGLSSEVSRAHADFKTLQKECAETDKLFYEVVREKKPDLRIVAGGK